MSEEINKSADLIKQVEELNAKNTYLEEGYSDLKKHVGNKYFSQIKELAAEKQKSAMLLEALKEINECLGGTKYKETQIDCKTIPSG